MRKKDDEGGDLALTKIQSYLESISPDVLKEKKNKGKLSASMGKK